MNFTNREGAAGQQPRPAHGVNHETAINVATTANTTLKNTGGSSKPPRSGLVKVGLVTILFSVSVILIGIICLLRLTDPTDGRFVERKHLQAVFLTNGQVYFGHIEHISSKLIDLRGIFYLNNNANQTQTNSSAANDLSLVKLGCELHGPFDQMVINQNQVTFWENLRDDGQVAKAVAQYVSKNSTLNCDQQAQDTQSAVPSASQTPQTQSTTPAKKP